MGNTPTPSTKRKNPDDPSTAPSSASATLQAATNAQVEPPTKKNASSVAVLVREQLMSAGRIFPGLLRNTDLSSMPPPHNREPFSYTNIDAPRGHRVTNSTTAGATASSDELKQKAATNGDKASHQTDDDDDDYDYVPPTPDEDDDDTVDVSAASADTPSDSVNVMNSTNANSSSTSHTVGSTPAKRTRLQPQQKAGAPNNATPKKRIAVTVDATGPRHKKNPAASQSDLGHTNGSNGSKTRATSSTGATVTPAGKGNHGANTTSSAQKSNKKKGSQKSGNGGGDTSQSQSKNTSSRTSQRSHSINPNASTAAATGAPPSSASAAARRSNSTSQSQSKNNSSRTSQRSYRNANTAATGAPSSTSSARRSNSVNRPTVSSSSTSAQSAAHMQTTTTTTNNLLDTYKVPKTFQTDQEKADNVRKHLPPPTKYIQDNHPPRSSPDEVVIVPFACLYVEGLWNINGGQSFRSDAAWDKTFNACKEEESKDRSNIIKNDSGMDSYEMIKGAFNGPGPFPQEAYEHLNTLRSGHRAFRSTVQDETGHAFSQDTLWRAKDRPKKGRAEDDGDDDDGAQQQVDVTALTEKQKKDKEFWDKETQERKDRHVHLDPDRAWATNPKLLHVDPSYPRSSPAYILNFCRHYEEYSDCSPAYKDYLAHARLRMDKNECDQLVFNKAPSFLGWLQVFKKQHEPQVLYEMYRDLQLCYPLYQMGEEWATMMQAHARHQFRVLLPVFACRNVLRLAKKVVDQNKVEGKGFPLVVLQTYKREDGTWYGLVFRLHPNACVRVFDIGHWTASRHEEVCGKVATFLYGYFEEALPKKPPAWHWHTASGVCKLDYIQLTMKALAGPTLYTPRVKQPTYMYQHDLTLGQISRSGKMRGQIDEAIKGLTSVERTIVNMRTSFRKFGFA